MLSMSMMTDTGLPGRNASMKRVFFIPVSIAFAVLICMNPVQGQCDDREIIFGAAVSEQAFNGYWDQRYDCMPEYRSELKRLFDWAVTMNTGKMERIHPDSLSFFWDDLDIMVDWFEENDMNLKFHTLVWDVNLPNWYSALDQSESRVALETHVRAIVDRYRGRIRMYDVVNEPLHRGEHDNYMGTGWTLEEAIVHIFTWAREEDPDATLMINEYYVLINNDYYSVLDEYIDLINAVRAAGAPIDAIGVQAHMGLITDSIALTDNTIISALDRLTTETGLPVYITEFDICPPGCDVCPGDSGDPDGPFEGFDSWWDYQASAERRIYEVFINHPNVYGVFRWYYYEMYDWNLPALFDIDFNPRPVFYSLEDLLVSASPPSIKSVTIAPNSGTVTVGDTIRITVTAENNETGLTPSNAQLNGVSVPLTGSGDGTYTGIYIVAADDQSAEYVEATGITLSGPGGTSPPASSTGSTLSIVTDDTYVESQEKPDAFILYQNTPNPFNPQTTIRYIIPQQYTSSVSVTIYDINGAVVRRFSPAPYSQGNLQSVVWDGRDAYGNPLASGLYFCEVTAGNLMQTNKMMLIR